MLAGRRVGVKLLYNPGDRKFRSVGEKMLEWEQCPSRGWARRPPVEQHRRTGKKRCYRHKSGVQYVAVLFSLQITSHSVNLFEPFQIKWEVYFSKEVSSLVFIVSSLWFYMHMYYLAIQQEDLSHFLEKYNIFKYVSTCQTRSYDFWIMNAMCTFMNLFVVYFSFAPVISASIHRYVNYFDI